MKTRKIEKMLRQESNLLLRDVNTNIKNQYFPTPVQRKYFLTRKIWIPLAAAIGIVLGFLVFPLNQATTYVAFAINPEIEFALNNKNTIVDVEGLNTDGAILVYDEDFRGLSLQAGIEQLMGLYDEYDYLDNLPTIGLLSYHRSANNESTTLDEVARCVQDYLDQHLIQASLQRFNQGVRATDYLRQQLQNRGYTRQQVRNKTLRQLLRLQSQYNEDEVKQAIAALKTYKETIAHMSPQARRMAMMNMKKNRLHGNN